MTMKNLMIAVMLVPALAACKSAYMGEDDASEVTAVQETPAVDPVVDPVVDPDDNRMRENIRETEQIQSGS